MLKKSPKSEKKIYIGIVTLPLLEAMKNEILDSKEHVD